MGLLIEWIDRNNNTEGYRIYRSEEYFSVENLPPPIAVVNSDSTSYYDPSGEKGKNWYRVGSFVGDTEAISLAFLGGVPRV